MYFGRYVGRPSSREARDSDTDFTNTTQFPVVANNTTEDLLNITTMATPTDLAIITNTTEAEPYLHLEVLKASFSLVLAQIDMVRRELIAYKDQSDLAAHQLRFEILLAVCLTGAVIMIACYSKRLCNIVGRCSRNCGRLCIASTKDDKEDKKTLAGGDEGETFIYYNMAGDACHFTTEDIQREVKRQALKNLRAQFEPGHKECSGSVNSAFTCDGSSRPTAGKKSSNQENAGDPPSTSGDAPTSS